MPPCPFAVAARREALCCGGRRDDDLLVLLRAFAAELGRREVADAAGRLRVEVALLEARLAVRLTVLVLLRGRLAPEPRVVA